MTYRLSNPLAPAVALAVLLSGAALFRLPLQATFAQDAGVTSPGAAISGQSTPNAAAPPPAPPPEKPATRPPFDPIEARITYLHERLRITPAEEPLWAKVAQAMRDNAQAVTPIIRERVQAVQHGNAMDYLNLYQKLGEAQLDGLKKFAAAFQALYADLSPAQKKIADSIFRLGPMSIVGGIPQPPEALAAPIPYEHPYYPPYATVPPPGYVYYPPPLYPYYYPYYHPWFWGPPIVFGVPLRHRFFHHPRVFEHPRPFDGTIPHR
jgi:hypothetical protein